MSNRHPAALTLITGIIALGIALPSAAESPKQIFETAKARYQSRVASIETVTIVHEVMGMETTAHLTKVMVEGQPELRSSGVERGSDIGSMYQHFDYMARNSSLKGKEDVDGRSCWVIEVAELGGMHLGLEASNDFEASDGTFHIDQKDYVVRRMKMNGVARRNGVKEPFTMDMHMTDYREIDGWLHPFQTEITLGGEGGGMSEEVAAMREGLAKMKEELAKMPAEQRQMMEQMMLKRMPNLEQATADGNLTITTTVKEIRVNEPVG